MMEQQEQSCDWFAVPHRDIPNAWQIAEPMIDDALCYSSGHQTSTDIFQALLDKKMLLLMRVGAVAVLEVLEYPRKKAVHAVIVAGSRMDDWIGALITHCEMIARDVGATEISACGRPGLGRSMKAHGFVSHSFVTKEVR